MNAIHLVLKTIYRAAVVLSLLFTIPIFKAVLAAGGVLDPTFDTDGIVTTSFGTRDDVAEAVVLQPDGKIVAAGWYANGTDDDFALARYNSTGLLDPTFDTDGKVTTAIGTFHEIAQAVLTQPDGKILVAGEVSIGADQNFALARYNSNGLLDPTFDTDGKVTTPIGTFQDVAESIVLQPDGKILAAGWSNNGSEYDFALARYNSNGSLDPTFDTDGKVTTNINGSSHDSAFDIALQPDGKILVAGESFSTSFGSNSDFVLVRYNSDGSPDVTFGPGGKVTTDFGTLDNGARAIVLQPDGRIIAAGWTSTGPVNDNDFALARYNSNGSLDNTFSSDGKTTTSFGSNQAIASDLALLPDGRIIAAGIDGEKFALARYNPDGSPDILFDSDGKLITTIGDGLDIANALALQPDGKIIVAGYSYNSEGNADFGLVRYLGDTATFADVPIHYWAWNSIERLYAAGITGGCGINPLRYCPESTVTRAQMAVFLERALHDSAFTPPQPTGAFFVDVPATYWASGWIEQLAAEGITIGCGAGFYCPASPVTRAQMAIFLLRAEHGSSYTPPAVGLVTGFNDVSSSYWAAAWIKQLAAEGITSGCGSGIYCPESPVTRAQMAVFLVKSFNLP